MLGRDLGTLKNIQWARRKQQVPEVMTREEIAAVLDNLKANRQKWLIASQLYGFGLRLLEALRLRVKDVEFGKSAPGVCGDSCMFLDV